jgi:hypothetical protein
MHRSFLALALAGVTLAASAQILVPTDPDWKELEAPPPPPLHTQGLIPLDVPSSTLHFGIDPASVTIGEDGIVRYVMVATSSGGAVNASYEGIHCHDGKVRVFARNGGSGWTPAPNSEWQALEPRGSTRYSTVAARSGVCRDAAPNRPVVQLLQDLRAPVDRRFERGGVNR